LILPRNLSRVDRLAIAALLVVAAAEIIAFLVMPFEGYDSPSHLFWVAEWRKMWADGALYPRWMPDSYHGFGAPSFYLYPPLAYMISSGVGLLVPIASEMMLIKIVTLLTLVLSGLAMYLYLRWRSRNASHSLALLVSLIYAFAPYRFFNMTVRAAFSEHVAFLFVPLAFWGLDLVIREKQAKRFSLSGFGLLAFSLALTLLSNLPASASILLLLLIYGLTQQKRWWSVAILSSIIAGCLAAAYVLPVLHFYHDAQLGRLWVPFPFAQSSPVLGVFTRRAVMINTYNLIGLAGALLLLFSTWKKAAEWKWLMVAVVLLQLPPFSYYLFLYVFPFTIVQLPARLMAGFLILLPIVWMDGLDERNRQKRYSPASFVILFWTACMVPLIVVQLSGFHIRAWINRSPDDPPEYATRWSPPYDSAAKAIAANDTGWTVKGPAIMSDIHNNYSDSVTFNATADTTLIFHRMFWPAWRVTLDSHATNPFPDSLGRLSIAAPSGRHTAIAELLPTQSEREGKWISMVSFIIFLLFLGLFRLRIARKVHLRSHIISA
jgi:hypothetical protein